MGVPAGIMTATGAQAKQRVSEGFHFVSVANDAVYLKTFAKQVLEEARSGLPHTSPELPTLTIWE